VVRAAQVHELGSFPEPVEVADRGELEVAAVALNPLDLAIAAGRFYGGHPPLPYIPGCEAVARAGDRRLYLRGDGRGVDKDGFLVERVSYPEELAIDVPDGLDDAAAAACGIAGVAGWMPVVRAEVSQDDRVLVLGATGSVGRVAVQAAKLRGARVVASGRDEARLKEARELGADATVLLGEPYEEDFDVIIDPLWGEPLADALSAAAPRARIVSLGQSAGPTATLPSGTVRGKELRILGYSAFMLTPEELREAYGEVARAVLDGRLRFEVERFPLERVADAWEAQASGAKAVVTL
jgi:NADPH2:quinone reductase